MLLPSSSAALTRRKKQATMAVDGGKDSPLICVAGYISGGKMVQTQIDLEPNMVHC